MDDVRYRALEYRADDSFEEAGFRVCGSTARGHVIERNGRSLLALGAGHRLLTTLCCGVCSTDLDRRFLPFPLPQVIGHEVVARDEVGQRYVVEINDSPAARGHAGDCPDCRTELARHCRRRIVLGIHDLPGGFGPYVLAPVAAAIPVPDALPTGTAVLVEPFAAALRAVERSTPRAGDAVAVLGARRLGMLLVAALAGVRRQRGLDFRLTAIVRRDALAVTARRLGADDVAVVAGDAGEPLPDASFDLVFDTSGRAGGLTVALRLARREVHLKSTHGRPAAGLAAATAFVVDELTLAPAATRLAPGSSTARVAWLGDPAQAPPALGAAGALHASPDAVVLRAALRAAGDDAACLAGADVVGVPDLASVDRAIRPSPLDEEGVVRPCGKLVLFGDGGVPSPLAAAVLQRGIVLSSSRCGDFRRALALLVGDPDLRALGDAVVTHRFAVAELARAFEVARSPVCLKAVVEHDAQS
ncbi:MAG: alcohol dehydrogenase catalytic domain-containing protein [Planctomycetes bacterium]|nr:alcohol dehydrogenase catalytic domain-containing protein [Planctomycetota bacterium]